MPAYLLTWNPARWAWDEVAEAAEDTAGGRKYSISWSCGNNKSIRAGDRIFLMRQGGEPRGVTASGRAVSDVEDGEHWSGDGRTALRIDVEFDRVLDPARNAPMPVAGLNGPSSKVHWSTASSGISIPADAVGPLESRWTDHLASLSAKKKDGRNPPWQRDELILALDLYIKYQCESLSYGHPDVVELSALLNRLPIHPGGIRAGNFRNGNGVVLKLLNFRRFDPARSGKGMSRGKRLEEVVWNQFATTESGRIELASVADSIRTGIGSVAVGSETGEPDEDEDAFPEGRLLYRLHRERERNKEVVRRAKDAALTKNGLLACAACGFDFARVYGPLGKGYIEAHHTTPVCEVSPTAKTRPSDIALLCSNCHRMAHRRRPWPSIDDLRSIVERARQDTATG